MGRLPWTLADFPQGYVLLLHITPRKTGSLKPRRDFFLYGAYLPYSPSFSAHTLFAYRVWIYALSTCVLCRRTGATDVSSFASPLEFVKHAEWLMRGAHRTLDKHRFPRCKCKYCHRDGSGDSANLKQSVISRELRRVRARVLTQIGGDEVEVTDNNGVIDAEDDANTVR